MRLVTEYWAKPIPMRQFDWSAVSEDYDGAEDSSTRNHIGYGRTEAEAIAALLEIMLDEGEITEDEFREALRTHGTQRYHDPDRLREDRDDLLEALR